MDWYKVSINQDKQTKATEEHDYNFCDCGTHCSCVFKSLVSRNKARHEAEHVYKEVALSVTLPTCNTINRATRPRESHSKYPRSKLGGWLRVQRSLLRSTENVRIQKSVLRPRGNVIIKNVLSNFHWKYGTSKVVPVHATKVYSCGKILVPFIFNLRLRCMYVGKMKTQNFSSRYTIFPLKPRQSKIGESRKGGSRFFTKAPFSHR